MNIDGLLSHKTQLEWIIHDKKPDIICLCETHITKDIEDAEINIQGYNFVQTLSTSRHTGGSIIYVKEQYRLKKIHESSIDMNMWMVAVELNLCKKKYNIFSVYHSPNSKASDRDFIEKFEDILVEWVIKGTDIIIIGDFNIDLAKKSYYGDELQSAINNLGLNQIMNQLTRVYDNHGSMIDLLITNVQNLQFEVHHTPKITDHSIIYVNLGNSNRTTPYRKKIRNMKNFNELDFQLHLMDSDWNSNISNCNESANNLVATLRNSLDKYMPEKEIIVTTNYGHKKWWTEEIGYEIHERDRLYKRAAITGNGDHWNEFKQQRNRVTNIIRNKKTQYYEEAIDDRKNDSREMWKTLKELVYGDKNKKKIGIAYQNKLYTDQNEIAELFNEYFIQSINEITKPLIKTIPKEQIIGNMNQINSSLNNFRKLNIQELRTITKQLNNKKSSTDGINIKILKIAFEAVGQRFLQVINNSLENGEFPKDWKHSVIIPIEKKTDTIICEEFRPVNMVPTYEKQLESVVNIQVTDYVKNNNILTKHQAGFQKNNSCESALQSVLVNWNHAISEKQMIGVVFLDFQRAFETVDRNLLLMKLQKIGFSGKVLQWFQDYLCNRMQLTKYNETESSLKNTSFGVPQGTVLGPTLFVIYINDIVKYVKNCKIQLFADDTILYVSGTKIEEIVDAINEDLKIIYQWLTSNNLKVNITKTKFMLIRNRYQSIELNKKVMLNDKEIEEVNEIKYLGVIIDNQLKYSNHASYITKKIAKKINLLGRIGQDLTVWAKRTIYESIIKPHFNYCSSILFLLSNKEINILQKKQNWAMRIVLKCSKYTSVKLMLDQLNILSVRQMIMLNTMIFIFKIINNLLPPHLLENCTFVYQIHNYNTRSLNSFYVPTVRTNYAQNTLFHKGLVMYNGLPKNVKNCSTVKLFKIKCSEYIKLHISM